MLIETIQNILIFLLKSAAIGNEWSERGFFERIQVFKWAVCVGTRCLSCMQKEQADCRTNEGPGLLVAPRIELIEQTIILPFSAHYMQMCFEDSGQDDSVWLSQQGVLFKIC